MKQLIEFSILHFLPSKTSKTLARYLTSSFLFSIVLLFASQGISQDQIDPLRSWGEEVVSTVRQELHSEMAAGDVTLDRSIEYDISSSPIVNAFAKREGSKRIIVLNEGLLIGLNYMVTMQVMSFTSNKMECFGEYTEYIGHSANTNNYLRVHGLKIAHTLDPVEYADQHRDICPSFTHADIGFGDKSKRTDGLYQIGIRQSFKFVILHELAHHRNGDVDKSVARDIQRIRERDADAFAIKSMLRPLNSPLAALPAMILFVSLGNQCVDDSSSDHPAGIKRLKAMVEAGQREMSSPSFQKQLKELGPIRIQEWKDALQLLAQVPE